MAINMVLRYTNHATVHWCSSALKVVFKQANIHVATIETTT